ncbi:hypothetical protein C6401_13550 [Arthrobacter woluwensis]|nr:hypothetical protein C6401_13550 [Arthrobacter woluwensis]
MDCNRILVRIRTAVRRQGGEMFTRMLSRPRGSRRRLFRGGGDPSSGLFLGAPARRLRSITAALAAVVLGLAATLAAVTLSAPAAAAATNTSCHFSASGTGKYADTLCWLDFSGLDPAQAATGQDFAFTIDGGNTLYATVTRSGGTIAPAAFPTWSGAYLGNRGFYSGTAGKPALYQTTDRTTSSLTLSNMRIVTPQGMEVMQWSIVGADAESTDVNESITWNSTNPITSLTATRTGNGLGNACAGGFTGVGTTQVKCTGAGTDIKTGTAILASQRPVTFSQTMVGGGREAVAFGVLVSSVKMNKAVASRFPGDDFQVDISSDAADVAHGSTGPTGTSATTGKNSVVTPVPGMPFHFRESAVAGDLNNYSASWRCTNFDQVDPSLPQGDAGTSQDIFVAIGDDVECTLTNTALSTGISLTKKAGAPVDANSDGITDAGDTIAYTFDVTNTGKTTLTNIAVDDPKVGPVTCPSGDLAPGASTTCTAQYTITADDENAGEVHNVAMASGNPPGSTATVKSATSETRTPVTKASPALTLVKSVDKTELVAGETLTYSFVITNTGNVPLNDVGVNETAFSGSGQKPTVSCPAAASALKPGDQVTCTATYQVTQEDVDRGSVENTATAHGTPPGKDSVTSDPSTAKVPEDPKPGISMIKSADKTELVAGQTITYSFAVKNTGNVTLKDVHINEGDFTGSGAKPQTSCPHAASSLAPGQQVTCMATYQVTQADVDRGSVDNTATATGQPPTGDPVTSDPSKVSVPAQQKPAISLTKTADKTELVAGQTITYSFVVKNTGNVTLSEVKVNEGSFTGSGKLSAITCPQSSLAPGDSETCTATYQVTQADVDRGSVENSATATGTPPNGADPVTSDPSQATVPSDPKPALSLQKTASPSRVGAVGDVISYSFVVTNTGNVTLRDVTIAEGAFTGSGTMSAVDCPEAAKSLAPGASVTCTATYRVAQADVDRGSVQNTAIAEGTPPTGSPVKSAPSSATVPVDQHPGISLHKSASTAELVAGQSVTYFFDATNTGNVTLRDVKITEGEFTGSGKLSAITCPDGAKNLAPGATVRCTASYTVTQADVDRGSVHNTATAGGDDPSGRPVTASPSEVTLPGDPKPGLTMVKSADKTELKAGETITYSFKLTNTGNVTLHDLKVTEGTFTGSGTLSAASCPKAPLAPGSSATCTATYRVTQADVDRGSVHNTATATGTPPTDDPVTSDPSEASVPQKPSPALRLVKTADHTLLGRAGEHVIYTFTLTNTGNVTLRDLTVHEGAFSGSGKLSPVSCPATGQGLAPGASLRCSATYVVTSEDLAAGKLSNTATASATAPGGAAVGSEPSSVTLRGTPPAPAPPALAETGAASGPALALGAAALVLAGLMISVAVRRREHRR